MRRIRTIRDAPQSDPMAVRSVVEFSEPFTVDRRRASAIRTRWVIVDYHMDVFGGGPETMAFPASEDGEVLDWEGLAVSYEADQGRAWDEVIGRLGEL